jgi:hypothetical protein
MQSTGFNGREWQVKLISLGDKRQSKDSISEVRGCRFSAMERLQTCSTVVICGSITKICVVAVVLALNLRKLV